MHKAITNRVFQHRLPERSSQGANHLKGVISHPWPYDSGHCEDWKGNGCPEQHPHKWQNTPGKQDKRCGQGWGHPIQTLNKSQKCTWLVRRQRMWHAVFSFIELSISCLPRQTCLGSSGKTCLGEHGPQAASQGRGGLGRTGRVLSSLCSAKEPECLSHSHHPMSLPQQKSFRRETHHCQVLLWHWLGGERA